MTHALYNNDCVALADNAAGSYNGGLSPSGLLKLHNLHCLSPLVHNTSHV